MIEDLSVIWWRDTARTSSLVNALREDEVQVSPNSFSKAPVPFEIPPRYFTKISVYFLHKHLNELFAFLVFPVYFFPSSVYNSIFARCDISKARYLSINERACLYALKCCQFFVDLYFFSFKFLLFFWSFSQVSDPFLMIFSLICTVHINGIFSATSIPFTLV